MIYFACVGFISESLFYCELVGLGLGFTTALISRPRTRKFRNFLQGHGCSRTCGSHRVHVARGRSRSRNKRARRERYMSGILREATSSSRVGSMMQTN